MMSQLYYSLLIPYYYGKIGFNFPCSYNQPKSLYQVTGKLLYVLADCVNQSVTQEKNVQWVVILKTDIYDNSQTIVFSESAPPSLSRWYLISDITYM